MTTVRKLNLPRVMAGKHLVWPSLSTGKIFGRLVFKSLSLTLLPVHPLWFGAKSDTNSFYRCSSCVSSLSAWSQ